MMFCHKCGKRLPADAVFCPWCGTEALGAEAEVSDESLLSPEPVTTPAPVAAEDPTHDGPSRDSSAVASSGKTATGTSAEQGTDYGAVGILTALFGVASFIASFSALSAEDPLWLFYRRLPPAPIVWGFVLFGPYLVLGILVIAANFRPVGRHTARVLAWAAFVWWLVTAYFVAVASGAAVVGSGALYGFGILVFLLKTRRGKAKAIQQRTELEE